LQKRKILVVSEIFWPEGGGAELATYLILRLLRDAGFEITVLTSTKNPTPIKGVKFYYTDLLKPGNRIERFLYTSVLAQKPWFKKLLKQHDTLYIPQMAYPLIPTAKREGLKVVVHLHNYAPVRYHGVKYYFEPDNPSTWDEVRTGIFHEYHIHKSLLRTTTMPISYLAYKLSRHTLEQADTIICVSKRQAEIVRQKIRHAKVEAVYNPPPPMPPIEKKPSETPTLLYVGGDSYLKGFPIALWALSKLRHNYKAYITGRVSAKWANLVNKLGGKVTLLGRIPYSDVLNLHAQAWTLLFPSIWEEPLPYAVVEALMAGTIPVAFAVGGVPEILTNSVGNNYLCKLIDPYCIIEKVNAILSLTYKDLIDISLSIKEQIKKILNIEAVNKIYKII